MKLEVLLPGDIVVFAPEGHEVWTKPGLAYQRDALLRLVAPGAEYTVERYYYRYAGLISVLTLRGVPDCMINAELFTKKALT